jgi:hypothetical protein
MNCGYKLFVFLLNNKLTGRLKLKLTLVKGISKIYRWTSGGGEISVAIFIEIDKQTN